MRKITLKFSKHFLLLSIVLLASVALFAQNKVTGKITDSNTGAPLANATVAVKGTKVAVQTASDGSYTIQFRQMQQH